VKGNSRKGGISIVKFSILKELWVFMKIRKRYWLAPILLILVLLSLLMVFAQTSVIAPFIYTMF